MYLSESVPEQPLNRGHRDASRKLDLIVIVSEATGTSIAGIFCNRSAASDSIDMLPWYVVPHAGLRYNARLFRLNALHIMEAEQLNQIESSLADLGERATQLRGFL